jgi:hypothetical protein
MTQLRKIHRTLLVAALGTLLPVGAAHAFEMLGNKIDDPMPGTRTPSFDASKYDRIEFLTNTAWTPKAGAEGPVRTETMARDTQASPQYQRYEILGNVFWFPKMPH